MTSTVLHAVPTGKCDAPTRSKQPTISNNYRQCASWLTYGEWKRLHKRAADRRRHAPKSPKPADVIAAILAAPLKRPVIHTLAVMHDHADKDGHLSVSRSYLANLLGISDRTIRRHWAIAEEAGYLTRYDYPEDVKRPSEFWLWAGDAPARIAFPEPEPFQPATGPAPF